jgi:pimeloyl-ACP methyl ester carboxylesterase
MKRLLVLIFFLVSCNSLNSHDLMMLKYANSNTNSKFMDIDGDLIHYRKEGKGPVIVLLPGTSDTLHSYEELVLELKDKYTLISLDLPGFGFSDEIKLSAKFLQDINKRLSVFLTRLDIDKFHLVGNSLGGLVGWSFNLEYPNRVNKLILLDPAAYPQDIPWFFNTKHPVTKIAGKYIFEYIPLQYLLQLYDNYSNELFGPAVNQPFMDEQIVRLAEIFQTEINIKKYTRTLDFFHAYKFLESKNIPKLKGEDILLIFGEHDGIIPYKKHLKKWKKDLPNINVHIRKGGGHLPHWEDPINLAKKIESFL